MDQQTEQKVLATLYDRLADAISYSPGDKPNGAPKAKLFMVKNLVLNPNDFANALSPGRPNGDQAPAENFSALVDDLPVVGQSEFAPSGSKVSEVYTRIVNGANAKNEVDPKQLETYNKAKAFLTTNTKIKSFDGTETEVTNPSPIAQAYDDNQTAYINALGGYRQAYNGYDLTKVSDQRAWAAVEPGLQNTVTQAWNKWVREGKAQVEQARDALQSTINDAVSQAIQQAQSLVDPQRLLPSLTPNGNKWLLSYALASNWADKNSTASKLSLKSSFLNQTASAEANSYSAGGGASWGLWSVGGSYGHSDNTSRSSMQSNDFELSAELIQVRIMRPWYNPLLFSMSGWSIKGQKASIVSAEWMPYVPVALIVARNVTIKAQFNDSDQQHFDSQTQAKTSVGWGPFSVSGSYSHSESNDRFTSNYSGGALQLPGLQVIGVLCAPTPNCPPSDG